MAIGNVYKNHANNGDFSMTYYPNGSIKSIEEFQKLFIDHSGIVYEASQKFQLINERNVTGNIIIKRYPDGQEYIGIEIIINEYRDTLSCLDIHLLTQEYNDWYLFTNEEDARNYVNGTD